MLVKFIIAALIIIAASLAFKTYQDGGFKDAHGVNVPVEQDVESH